MLPDDHSGLTIVKDGQRWLIAAENSLVTVVDWFTTGNCYTGWTYQCLIPGWVYQSD